MTERRPRRHVYCRVSASQVYGVDAVTPAPQVLSSRAGAVSLWALARHRCLTEERLDPGGLSGAQGTSWSSFGGQGSLKLLEAHGTALRPQLLNPRLGLTSFTKPRFRNSEEQLSAKGASRVVVRAD